MGDYNKNYREVNKYYNDNQEYEFLMCFYLNKNLPQKMVKTGFSFEVQTDGKYNKHDINLIKINPNRDEKEVVARIEYEYAATQDCWDFELPRDKWSALNLITRKDYDNNFDIFLKSSPTFNSFFAIDCRNKFISGNFSNIEKIENHSLSFETNDDFYRIYWDDVSKHEYLIDKTNKKLKNGNICIIEHSDYSHFYRFLWTRFIKNL